MKLFENVVPPEKQHSNYRMITSGMCGPELEVIQNWAEGFVDRDGKFVTEFQTTFNSSFWELYLHAAFRHLGMDIDFSHTAPDFVVSRGTRHFVAEATIASNAEGFTAEWQRDVSSQAIKAIKIKEVIDLATVRLASAIDAKWRKFGQSYCNLEHVKSRPYLICVAPFDQPYFFMQSDNALRRVLYGHEQILHFDNPNTGIRTIVGELRSTEFKKPSGSSVPIGFFRDDRMADVSAVIFSNTATFGKVRALTAQGEYPMLFMATRYNDHGLQPFQICAEKSDYKETLLDGLHVCLNPFAKHPVDEALFEGREVCVHRFDPDSGIYSASAPHGFLFARNVLTFPPRERAKEARMRAPEARPMMPWPKEVWPDGVLVQVHASVGPFTDHYMAHYRGWTILVVRDQVDNDWSSQAIASEVDGLDDYIRLNSTTEVELLISGHWLGTRDEAFQAIKRQIDARISESGVAE